MSKVSLPCFPCPHKAACCSEGAPLKSAEATLLSMSYGPAAVEWDPEEKQYRTKMIGNGACWFLRPDTGCSLHGSSLLPAVCAGFPFRDDGSEVDICPELLVGKYPEMDRLFDPTTKRLRVTTKEESR